MSVDLRLRYDERGLIRSRQDVTRARVDAGLRQTRGRPRLTLSTAWPTSGAAPASPCGASEAPATSCNGSDDGGLRCRLAGWCGVLPGRPRLPSRHPHMLEHEIGVQSAPAGAGVAGGGPGVPARRDPEGRLYGAAPRRESSGSPKKVGEEGSRRPSLSVSAAVRLRRPSASARKRR